VISLLYEIALALSKVVEDYTPAGNTKEKKSLVIHLLYEIALALYKGVEDHPPPSPHSHKKKNQLC